MLGRERWEKEDIICKGTKISWQKLCKPEDNRVTTLKYGKGGVGKTVNPEYYMKQCSRGDKTSSLEAKNYLRYYSGFRSPKDHRT